MRCSHSPIARTRSNDGAHLHRNERTLHAPRRAHLHDGRRSDASEQPQDALRQCAGRVQRGRPLHDRPTFGQSRGAHPGSRAGAPRCAGRGGEDARRDGMGGSRDLERADDADEDGRGRARLAHPRHGRDDEHRRGDDDHRRRPRHGREQHGKRDARLSERCSEHPALVDERLAEHPRRLDRGALHSRRAGRIGRRRHRDFPGDGLRRLSVARLSLPRGLGREPCYDLGDGGRRQRAAVPEHPHELRSRGLDEQCPRPVRDGERHGRHGLPQGDDDRLSRRRLAQGRGDGRDLQDSAAAREP